MKPIRLKVARIGNSRGVRIPAPTLQRYRIGDKLNVRVARVDLETSRIELVLA